MSLLGSVIFFCSVICGNALLYLCHHQQACLEKPLPARPWLLCAAVIHVHAFFVAHTYLNLLAACCAYLALCMLSLGLIPFVSLILGRKSYANGHR
jgi:hypothetical protein